MITTWDIAKAVQHELSIADLPKTAGAITATFLPRFNVDDITDLHVTVLPAGVELTPETRALDRETHRVQVGIHQHIDPAVIDDVDQARGELLAYARTLARHMRLLTLSQAEGVRYQGASINLIYEPAMLELNIYQAVIELTYICIV